MGWEERIRQEESLGPFHSTRSCPSHAHSSQTRCSVPKPNILQTKHIEDVRRTVTELYKETELKKSVFLNFEANSRWTTPHDSPELDSNQAAWPNDNALDTHSRGASLESLQGHRLSYLMIPMVFLNPSTQVLNKTSVM